MSCPCSCPTDTCQLEALDIETLYFLFEHIFHNLQNFTDFHIFHCNKSEGNYKTICRRCQGITMQSQQMLLRVLSVLTLWDLHTLTQRACQFADLASLQVFMQCTAQSARPNENPVVFFYVFFAAYFIQHIASCTAKKKTIKKPKTSNKIYRQIRDKGWGKQPSVFGSNIGYAN